MEIELAPVKVRDVIAGYVNAGYDGVIGFSGKLNIRPAYQREFVYSTADQAKVIETVLGRFPLNVMYWSKTVDPITSEIHYEMLDGQQRTMSIGEFVQGNFSVAVAGSPRNFGNLSAELQARILDYELLVYIVEGSEDDRLAWFEIINIAGYKLTPQELRNAIYTGQWLTSAKRYFSRPNEAADRLALGYLNTGEVNRQALLERAISWHATATHVPGRGDEQIKSYMNTHRADPNADELWTYFKSVIDWAKLKFPKKRSQMKTVPWADLYERFGAATLDADRLEVEVARLMLDDEVTRKAGAYEYAVSLVATGTANERVLSLRTFPDSMKREAFERQKGVCPWCNNTFEISQMQADHITPWSLGGKTIAENCQMLCADCNRRKSNV